MNTYYVYTVCIAPPLMEVLHYIASNVVVQSKYAMEECLISTWDSPIYIYIFTCLPSSECGRDCCWSVNCIICGRCGHPRHLCCHLVLCCCFWSPSPDKDNLCSTCSSHNIDYSCHSSFHTAALHPLLPCTYNLCSQTNCTPTIPLWL